MARELRLLDPDVAFFIANNLYRAFDSDFINFRFASGYDRVMLSESCAKYYQCLKSLGYAYMVADSDLRELNLSR